MVHDVLQKDPAVSKLDRDGKTPLWWAIILERQDVVRLLLQQSTVNPSLEDRCGPRSEGLVSLAARTLQPAMLDALIESLPININSKDIYGMTALVATNSSCFRAHLNRGEERAATVERILKVEGIQVNIEDNKGNTALHEAAVTDNVKTLVRRLDIDKNIRGHEGRTPLHYAAMCPDTKSTELLLHAVDIEADVKDDTGMTPLAHASRQGNYDAVLLLASRTDVNVQSIDNHGRTPLHHAVMENHLNVVKLLLSYKSIRADVKDDKGWTPLVWAANKANKEAVELLNVTY